MGTAAGLSPIPAAPADPRPAARSTQTSDRHTQRHDVGAEHNPAEQETIEEIFVSRAEGASLIASRDTLRACGFQTSHHSVSTSSSTAGDEPATAVVQASAG